MLGRVLTRTEQLLLLAIAASVIIGGASLYYYKHKSAAKSAAPTILPAAPTAVEPAVTTIPVEAPVPSAPHPEPPPIVPPEPIAQIAVSVVGAVNKPGLVRVRYDARVQDALTAAGGASDEADVTDLNFAARLIDGSTLAVPARASSERDGARLSVRGGATAAQINPPQYTVSGWNGTGSVARPIPVETVPRAAVKESDANPKAADIPKSGLLDLNTATAEELDTLPGIGPKYAAEIIAYRERTPFASVEDVTNVPGIGARRLDAIRNLITVQGSAATPPAPKSEENAKPNRRAPSKTSP